jgi:hypothetical protein
MQGHLPARARLDEKKAIFLAIQNACSTQREKLFEAAKEERFCRMIPASPIAVTAMFAPLVIPVGELLLRSLCWRNVTSDGPRD